MIVIIYAHPYPRHSRANSALLDALENVPQMSVRSLYDLYPDFNIDVPAEQAALAAADLIVWQHPMHWYCAPPLFRLWMDKVLQHGWAYGTPDSVLRGKDVLWAVTTGGAADDFTQCVQTDLGVLGQPLRNSAEVCGMRWLEPFSVHGVNTMKMAELNAAGARYLELLAPYGAAAAERDNG
jgi:glutathione-regulated potassium-efflux system ancillary protein KefF